MDHILWHCTFSTQIWHWVSDIFQCIIPKSFEDVMMISRGKSSAVKEIWYNCAFNTMVEIWFTRNSALHEGMKPDVEKLKQRIMKITGECSVRMKGKVWGKMYDLQILLFFRISGIQTKTTRVIQCLFQLPRWNQVLICCDGASKGNPGVAGLGFVARSNSGLCVGAASGGFGITTNYLAEVMALVVAGEWAVSKSFQEVCFQLDSNAVLVALSTDRVPWIIKSRWEKIKRNNSSINLKHSYREVNFSADNMAKKGTLLNIGVVKYYNEKPEFLGRIETEEDIYFRFS
ncbi:uncharacterized protein LOC113295204 [Papaver somniferum]|uniref:uncharacterized protein LOC113295204 n=1 Tax=Papaver somniferum TaxID=3469 RepID=UPI000E6FFCED|nr:uncharacterized protein LOC113295204 [Papaver somniferum]